MTRPLPKWLTTAINEKFSDRVENVWREKDFYDKEHYWVLLKLGWCIISPTEGRKFHVLAEPCKDRKTILRNLESARPGCDCSECKRIMALFSEKSDCVSFLNMLRKFRLNSEVWR
jgi:hypothetical protein